LFLAILKHMSFLFDTPIVNTPIHTFGLKHIMVYHKWQPQIPFWELFKMYLNTKQLEKNKKNLKTMLKLIKLFFVSKLIVPYFQPFQTPLLSSSHEKHPF